MPLPRVLRPLQQRDFALLWTGQTLSSVGDFVHAVALPVQALALTRRPTDLAGLVGTFATAQVAFLLFGGAVVDRLPRRTVLIWCDVVRGVVVTTIAALGLAGQLQVQHLYVAEALFGASAAFFQPAMRAATPELVDAETLAAANVLRSYSRQGGRIVGPALGGLLVAVSGPASAFAFDGATFVVSVVALVVMRSRASGSPPAPRRALLTEVGDGLRYAVATPWILASILIFSVWNAAFNATQGVVLPVLSLGYGGATALGSAYTAYGVGQLMGGLAVAQRAWRRPGVALYLAAALVGCAIVGFGLTTSLAVVVALAFVTGVGVVTASILWDTLLQRHVEQRILGRVSSADLFGSFILNPVAPLAVGALIVGVGASAATAIVGAVAASVALVGLALPSIRALRW